MNMETPRTDKAVKESNGQWSYVLADTCKQLERELAETRKQIEANHKGCELLERMVYEAREQRDTLTVALETVVEVARRNLNRPHPTIERVYTKALATLKGGQHE